MLIRQLDPGFFSDSQLEQAMSALTDSAEVTGWASLRRARLQAEQALRKGEQVSAHCPSLPDCWPRLLRSQIARERDWLVEDQRGYRRVALPVQGQQLWASYKYSVMARSVPAYQLIGQRVAQADLDLDALWLMLETRLRVRPTPGGVRNALQHMWGYVSRYADQVADHGDSVLLLETIQRLAYDHDVRYLLASTALSELTLWVHQ